MKDVPATENLGPVVLAVADQRQFLRPRIGHVARDVEQVFAEPDDRTGDTRRSCGTMKMDRGSERKDELEQSAAVDRRPRAEYAHQRMPGLMQRQIRAVQQRHPTLLTKPMERETHGSKSDDREKLTRGDQRGFRVATDVALE